MFAKTSCHNLDTYHLFQIVSTVLTSRLRNLFCSPACKQHPAAGVGVETNSSARGPLQLQMSGSSWSGINLGVCYHHLAGNKQAAERGLQLRNTFLPLLPARALRDLMPPSASGSRYQQAVQQTENYLSIVYAQN